MQAIVIQMEKELEKFEVKKESLKTLFIGGGTPSSIEASLYLDFFKLIHPYMQKDAELTTEANPNSATKKWLEQMKSFGINRVSFGVQSFDNEKLKFLGRNHSNSQAKKAVKNAKEVGIENISIDLIYGTKIDTPKLLKNDIQTAMDLPINHISSYALSIEGNTKFEGKDEYANNSSSLAKEFISLVKSYGFEQYEISNFGKYKSNHNLGYWAGEDYIGIGAGAVGFLKEKRFYPQKDIASYIKNPLQVRVENLKKEDLHIEKIFLGLRSEIGLSKTIFSQEELEKLDFLVREKKLTYTNGTYYNNDYLLSDEIALYIIS